MTYIHPRGDTSLSVWLALRSGICSNCCFCVFRGVIVLGIYLLVSVFEGSADIPRYFSLAGAGGDGDASIYCTSVVTGIT